MTLLRRRVMTNDQQGIREANLFYPYLTRRD
jgi:hypothetical protein